MRKPEWLSGLRDLVTWADFPQGRIVEIGSYEGQSTEIFAQSVRKVIAVDPFVVYGKTPKAVILSAFAKFKERATKYPNIVHIRDFSDRASRIFENGELDSVYVDGLHDRSHVLIDFMHWLPKVKPGGVFSGHDYLAKRGDVKEVVDQYMGKPTRTFADTSFAFRLSDTKPWFEEFPRILEARQKFDLVTFR
jgi:predicted O-methyltransferase YrrM